jgi:hypothetical protein
LACKPKTLRRLENGRTPKTQDQLLLIVAQPDGFGNHGRGAVPAGQEPAHARMKPSFPGGQVAFQKRQRKLDGDELMPLPAPPASRQGGIVLRIEPGHERAKLEGFARRANVGMAGEIETNLQAAGMKRSGPIQAVRPR